MLMPSLIDFMGGNWWLKIGQTELLFTIISFIINLIVMTIVFYVAGVIVVGKRKALFSDAFVISLLGTIVLIICLQFFGFVVGGVLSLIVWLLLIKHYYEAGWFGAIAVGIMALIVSVVIIFVIAFIVGISILFFAWLPFL